MINPGELLQLEWRHPWWGLLVLQPLIMALLLKLRRTQVLHYADTHLLAWVVRGNFGANQNRWIKIIHLIAWLLLACAAAGPRLPLMSEGSVQKQASRHEMDIMVVLDVSPSMQAQDISPDRLQRARLELQDWLLQLRGERLGLVAFSGGAGLLMPLSRDVAAFRYYLQLADSSLFEMPGTAMSDALALAQRKLLLQEKSASRAVLLVTDGDTSALSGPAGLAVQEAVANLKQAGIKLYILGIGTQAGAPIPLAKGGYVEQDGAQVISRQDQAGFSDLAQLTGGKFVTVEDGAGDWHKLYDNGLLALPGNHRPAENVHAWRELYPWFLLPALVLLFVISFPVRLKSIKPVAVLLFLLMNAPVENMGLPLAEAADTGWQDAYNAYRSHNYTLAQTLYSQLYGYSARMGEGAAAYRRRDYLYAVRQYSLALLEAREVQQRAAALFNLGNSYYLAGNDRAAADAYVGVLRLVPANRNAAANLALVSAKLARQTKPDKFSAGILGRRGAQTGGDLGQDISGVPVSIEPSVAEKGPQVQPGAEPLAGENATSRQNRKQSDSGVSNQTIDTERFYRAALKKLELVADKPAVLQKEMIKVDPAHAPATPGEMQPW